MIMIHLVCHLMHTCVNVEQLGSVPLQHELVHNLCLSVQRVHGCRSQLFSSRLLQSRLSCAEYYFLSLALQTCIRHTHKVCLTLSLSVCPESPHLLFSFSFALI